jgi:hypothetical protein
MVVRGDLNKLEEEHRESHEETIMNLRESAGVLKTVHETLSESKIRLHKAAKKYEERLHGPTDIGHH